MRMLNLREVVMNLQKEVIGSNVWLTRALPCNQIAGSIFLRLLVSAILKVENS